MPTLEELEDWILEVASSAVKEAERCDVALFLDKEVERQPAAAGMWYLRGYARYHLWRPLRPGHAVEALESFSRALRLAPDYEFARIYAIYVTFESSEYRTCIALCKVLNRQGLFGTDQEWRLTSIDEIEFASLLELRILEERTTALFWQIAEACIRDASSIWPFDPQIFLSYGRTAVEEGLIADRSGQSAKGILKDIEATKRS